MCISFYVPEVDRKEWKLLHGINEGEFCDEFNWNVHLCGILY